MTTMQPQRTSSGTLTGRRRSARLSGRRRATAPAMAGVSCSIPEPFLSSSTIREGAVGDHVQSLQWYLKEWGYYTGSLDGLYGPATREAVKLYQADAGVSVDGVVGPETQGALCTSVEYWTASGEPFPGGTGGDGTGGDGGAGGGTGGGSGGGAGGGGGMMPTSQSDRYLLYGVTAAAGVGLAVLFARKNR